MVAVQPLVSEFTLVGRLEDFVVSSKGRVKFFSLSTPEADYTIEVAKEQANVLGKYLKPGCHLKVSGMQKNKLHQGEISYKAYAIELLPESATSSNTVIKTNKSKAQILICQGSSCCKKGSKATYELLKAELQAQGMIEKVAIKTTGCLKQCKQAPNIVMPNRNRYSKVKPQQVSQLITKYFQS
jgi:(2Fe-2S) ferredoxin